MGAGAVRASLFDVQGARGVRVEFRGPTLGEIKLGTGLHEYAAIAPMEMGLLIQSSDPEYTRFQGSSRGDWSINSAFHDDSTAKQQKEQFTVLLDSAQMGGIALSVGVVWWASRVTGVIGSLLASMPAWRQLDPLPVVGRDDEEGPWSEQDHDAYADELAISMVLDGPRDSAMTMA